MAVKHGIGGVHDVGVDRCTRVLVTNCANVVLIGCTIDKIQLSLVEEIDEDSRSRLPSASYTDEDVERVAEALMFEGGVCSGEPALKAARAALDAYLEEPK